jgi:cation diffusion facilitator CzcD-associated flavoprotein CzcO
VINPVIKKPRRSSASGRVRVAIVGGGLGGIAMAVKLSRAGIRDFTVFERSDGPGGVWHENTYPGCEVDTPSMVYSFSFMPYDWVRTHATQPELQEYAHRIVAHFGIADRFRYGTQVVEAVWDRDDRLYHVLLDTGERLDFEVVVSAVGMFNAPQYPSWPGLDSFVGPLFHSARWEHEHDLTGKRVAVVGTGCTATQIAPALADTVEELILFQREPAWIIPKGERKLSLAERQALSRPSRRALERHKAFRTFARYLTAFIPGTPGHGKMTQLCLDYIASEIADPVLREQVTPKYPFGCKRVIKSSSFYSTLVRPNVHLVPKAVEAVTCNGLVDADGVEHPVDVIVLGTGFDAVNYLSSLRVVGVDGRSIHEIWDGDPKAYAGLTVPGLPNFYMVYGPNTNGGGPITFQMERQAEAITRIVKRMVLHHYRSVDTKPEALHKFVEYVDRHNALQGSATAAGCHNYFFSPHSGRNVTQWPLSHRRYMLKVWTAEWLGMRKSR